MTALQWIARNIRQTKTMAATNKKHTKHGLVVPPLYFQYSIFTINEFCGCVDQMQNTSPLSIYETVHALLLVRLEPTLKIGRLYYLFCPLA